MRRAPVGTRSVACRHVTRHVITGFPTVQTAAIVRHVVHVHAIYDSKKHHQSLTIAVQVTPIVPEVPDSGSSTRSGPGGQAHVKVAYNRSLRFFRFQPIAFLPNLKHSFLG